MYFSMGAWAPVPWAQWPATYINKTTKRKKNVVMEMTENKKSFQFLAE